MGAIVLDTFILDDFNDEEFILEESVEDAKEILKILERDNILLSGNFEDDYWTCEYDSNTFDRGDIDFSRLFDDDIKTKVKCWAALQLKDKRPQTVHGTVRNLIEFIKETDAFNVNLIEDDIENVLNTFNLASKSKNSILSCAINFLDFIQQNDLKDGTDYENTINTLRTIRRKYPVKSNRRKLPPYKDVIRFAFILDTFTKYWTEKEKLKYFPVLLWWKITSIIPMRASEFCNIKRDCLSVKDGIYYIELPRGKMKGSNKKLEVMNRLPISAEVAKLIEEYQTMTKFDTETETLISYKAYRESHHRNKSVGNTRVFTLKQFKLLLPAFYREVVQEKWGLNLMSKSEYFNIQEEKEKEFKSSEDDVFPSSKIVQIQPGDTRHFSICNMMLQGMNRLTIARMAGHTHLETQYHYQGHLEYFVDSKVYELTLLNNLKNQVQFTESDFESSLTIKDILIKSLAPREIFGDAEDEVEIGYCTDSQKRCESDVCILCSKNWIPREEVERKLSEIIEMKTNIKKKIKIKQDTLLRLYNEMTIEYGTERVDPKEDNELKRNAKELVGDMSDYAAILNKIS